eukprot:scaffold1500_cov100-Isochrysis_galbana.AAC.3
MAGGAGGVGAGTGCRFERNCRSDTGGGGEQADGSGMHRPPAGGNGQLEPIRCTYAQGGGVIPSIPAPPPSTRARGCARSLTHAVPTSFAYVSTSSGRSRGPARHARAATAASSSPSFSRSPARCGPSEPQLSQRPAPLRDPKQSTGTPTPDDETGSPLERTPALSSVTVAGSRSCTAAAGLATPPAAPPFAPPPASASGLAGSGSGFNPSIISSRVMSTGAARAGLDRRHRRAGWTLAPQPCTRTTRVVWRATGATQVGPTILAHRVLTAPAAAGLIRKLGRVGLDHQPDELVDRRSLRAPPLSRDLLQVGCCSRVTRPRRRRRRALAPRLAAIRVGLLVPALILTQLSAQLWLPRVPHTPQHFSCTPCLQGRDDAAGLGGSTGDHLGSAARPAILAVTSPHCAGLVPGGSSPLPRRVNGGHVSPARRAQLTR